MYLNQLLEKQTSERKLRLFAVACCNEILHLMKDQRSIQAIKIAELYADGLSTKEELRKADAAAYAAYNAANDTAYPATYNTLSAASAAFAASAAAVYDAYTAAYAYTAAHAADAADVIADEVKQKQLKIAEDIFESINLTLVTSPLIVTIAKTIYEDKCWSDMSILADSLEDNACKNKQILDHLRFNELHVRGCWVLDLILGKE